MPLVKQAKKAGERSVGAKLFGSVDPDRQGEPGMLNQSRSRKKYGGKSGLHESASDRKTWMTTRTPQHGGAQIPAD